MGDLSEKVGVEWERVITASCGGAAAQVSGRGKVCGRRNAASEGQGVPPLSPPTLAVCQGNQVPPSVTSGPARPDFFAGAARN